jgi:hypothetical protein
MELLAMFVFSWLYFLDLLGAAENRCKNAFGYELRMLKRQSRTSLASNSKCQWIRKYVLRWMKSQEFIFNHTGVGYSPVTNGDNYLDLITNLSFRTSKKILPSTMF